MEQKKIKNNFISLFTKNGKKSKTLKIYNETLFSIKKKTKSFPSDIIHSSVNNLLPKLHLKKLNRNRSSIVMLNKNQQLNKSLRWIFSNKRNILVNNILQVKSKTGLIYKHKKQSYLELEKFKYTVY